MRAWLHRNQEIMVFTILVAIFLLGFGLGFTFGFASHDELDLWDKAAAVGDSFSGHDITEGHHVEGDWVEGSNADIDAAVGNFIDYRSVRYGENWRVTGGSCGGRTVERMA